MIDSNVWVAALRSRDGASFRLLEAVLDGRIEAFASPALMLEYEDVLLQYEDVLLRTAQLAAFWTDANEVARFIGTLADRMRPVQIYFSWRPQLRDADDELVLECAANARARAIVTFNLADFLPAAHEFGIDVLRPGVVVRRHGLMGGMLQ